MKRNIKKLRQKKLQTINYLSVKKNFKSFWKLVRKFLSKPE